MVPKVKASKLGEDIFSILTADAEKVLLMAGIAGIAKVRRIAFPPANQIMLVTVGDLRNNMLPSEKDLKRIATATLKQAKRFMAESATIDTRTNQTFWVFFSPILDLRVVGSFKRPMVIAMVGDREYSIYPDKKDLDAINDLLGTELKTMGARFRAISVLGTKKRR